MEPRYAEKNIEKPKKHIGLGWKIFFGFLAIIIALFYVASHKLNAFISNEIRVALQQSGVEAEFDLDIDLFTHSDLKNVTLKKEGHTLSIKDGSFSLISSPIQASLNQITYTPAKESGIEGSITIPDIKLGVPSYGTSNININLHSDEIIHQDAKKPFFAPIKLNADLIYKDAKLDFDLEASDTQEKWKFTTRYNLDERTGSWIWDANLDPVTFESGLLQPDQLFPILRGVISHAEGSIIFSSHFEQASKDAEQTGAATLTMNNLSATIDDIDVKGVNGSIVFESLLPLITKGEQSITIKEIVFGLPLSEGKVPFNLIKNDTLRIGATKWRWAGGVLRTEPMELNLANPEGIQGVKLKADQLMLEALLAGLLEEGLSATGKLSGSLPLRFEAGKPVITGGILKTDSGGIVRYIPGPDSGMQKGTSFQTDLLLDAMKNFHYEFLNLKIDSIEDEKIRVQLSTKGRNPDLYDGKPIELNVNLTGNLFDIARSGTETYAIPKRIQEEFAK